MKKFVAIILAFVMIAMCFVGCAPADDNQIMTIARSDRFVVVETQNDGFVNVPPYDIIVDTYTNVSYIFLGNSAGSAITVLVDADGNPMLWEGDLK